MEQGFSFGNIFKNMTKQQKIASLLFVVIVVVLLIVLGVLLSGMQTGSFDENGEWVSDDAGQSDQPVVEEETYENDEGYTVTKKTTINPDGTVTIIETKMDEYGNVTTVDPDLITSYFPYQVMRKHDNLDEEWEYTLRYSLQLDEEAKAINATIEYCDVDGDKALVEQYINSIPLDLSGYTVNYETFAEDAICDVP